MLLKVLIIIFSIIILLIVLPHKMRIKYRIYSNEKKKIATTTDNIFVFYIFGFIPIKKSLKEKKEDKNLKNNKKSSNKEKKVLDVVYNVFSGTLKCKKIDDALLNRNDIKKIKDSIYFQKFHFDLGINLKEIFLNVYALGIINTLIPMYIALNQKNFDMENTEYSTYISNNIVDLNLDCIMKVNLIHTISVIVKVIYKIRKVESKNGRATSNRKFNDDSYDIARKYD